ncbi:MAG: hypothetical protein VW775_00665 [Schleiferiaceae bacterium]
MKKPTQWPEIYVGSSFLQRKDIVQKVIRTDEDTCHVTYEHPVLGTVTEIFAILFKQNLICLKCSFPHDMQDPENIEIAKDYYNGYILEGHDTYLEYFNESLGGWYLLSRNVEDEEKEPIRGI